MDRNLHRGLDSMALETRSLGLGSRNAPRPSAMSTLLAGLDARRHDRRDWARQHAGVAVSNDVNVIAAGQHRCYAFEALLTLLRIEPRDRCLLADEPLKDDPVDLRRGRRLHHRLLDEPGKCSDDPAGINLPRGKRGFALRSDPCLYDDRGLAYLVGATFHGGHVSCPKGAASRNRAGPPGARARGWRAAALRRKIVTKPSFD